MTNRHIRFLTTILVSVALTVGALGCKKSGGDDSDGEKADVVQNEDKTDTENSQEPDTDSSATEDADDSAPSDAASQCVKECVQKNQMQAKPIDQIRKECKKKCR